MNAEADLPLIEPKFSPPTIDPGALRRPALVDDLINDARSLARVVAPAGFGKTTLLSQVVEACHRDGNPIAWLSLDTADNDPARLWNYLRVALERALGADAAHRADRRGDRERALGLVGRAEHGLVMVIDEIEHLTSPDAVVAVGELARFVPDGVRLLLGGRRDPGALDAYLVTGQVHELGGRELRFDADDVAALIGASAEGSDADEILRLTDGWPVAVRLATRLQDSSRLHDASDLASTEAFRRYVQSSVIDQLDDPAREFLVDISILDRVHPDLCDFIRGREDAAVFIDRLGAHGLFVAALGGSWYRVHELLRDALAAQLDDARRAELHRRASEWFGEVDDPDEAVRHMIASGDFRAAGRLMFHYLTRYETQGRSETLRAWFEALPESVRLEPATALGRAWNLVTGGHPGAALNWLDRAFDHDDSTAYHLMEAEVVRAFCYRMIGDFDATLDAVERCLALRADVSPDQSVVSAVTMAGIQRLNVELWRDELDAAVETERWVRAATADELRSVGRVRTRCLQAVVEWELGDIAAATSSVDQTMLLAADLDLADTRAVAEAHEVAAGLAWERGDRLPGTNIDRAVACARLNRFPSACARVLANVASLMASVGETDNALDLVGEVESLRSELHDPILGRRASAVAIDVGLRTGDLDEVARRLRHLPSESRSVPTRLMRIRALRALGRTSDARHELAGIRPVGDRLAVLHGALRADLTVDVDEAIAVLGEATAIAERAGLWRSLIDELGGRSHLVDGLIGAVSTPHVASLAYLRRLRTAVGASHGFFAADPLADLLTDRELALAGRLDTRLSTAQLGAELHISTNTVKTHLKNIYRKLDVASRDEACQRIDRIRRGEG